MRRVTPFVACGYGDGAPGPDRAFRLRGACDTAMRSPAPMLRRLRRVVTGLACVLALCGGAAIAGETTTGKAFARFESAWTAASSAKVTALMEPKGKLRVSLREPSSGGTWTADQARRGLDTYFGSRGVSGPKLKAVAPRKGQKNTVRVYDYTYRPHGKDKRTTRLTVTLKQDAKKRWVLASVVESPKR